MRCRVVARGGGICNPRRRRPIGVVVVAPDGAGARSGIQRCRGSMWCWMVARGPTQRWHLVITIVVALGGGVAVKWNWRRGESQPAVGHASAPAEDVSWARIKS
jgi:hypothetical protein